MGRLTLEQFKSITSGGGSRDGKTFEMEVCRKILDSCRVVVDDEDIHLFPHPVNAVVTYHQYRAGLILRAMQKTRIMTRITPEP